MGLVHDEGVVVAQDVVAGGLHAQHRVVGDHDVRAGRLLARLLREALGRHRALAFEAFAPRDGHLRPRAPAHAGHQVVPVARVGLFGPRVEAHHLAAQVRGGADGQRAVLVLAAFVAAGHLVHAQVVAAALEQRAAGAFAERGFERVDHGGQVLGEHLALQGQGRGGDHDAFVGLDGARDRGHQVGQGLSRAGARLDQQVFAAAKRGLDGLGHRLLALASLPTHGGDDAREKLGGTSVGRLLCFGHDAAEAASWMRAASASDDVGHQVVAVARVALAQHFALAVGLVDEVAARVRQR